MSPSGTHHQKNFATAMGKFFFHTMASIAELERESISKQTKSGFQAAKSRGKKSGKLTKREDKIEIAIKMYKSKDYSIQEITEMTALSKTTLYQYLEKT